MVYVGRSRSLRRRLAEFAATPLGDDGPHHGGHWLKTLRGYDRARVWWAETDAPEEYEDALLTAFGRGRRGPGRPAVRQPALAGQRLAHARHHRRGEGCARLRRRRGARGRAAAGSIRRTSTGTSARRHRHRPARAVSSPRRAPGPPHHHRTPAVVLTAEGQERIQAELDDLRATRPDVIGRVKAARELGDLRENAEYQAAREEQSFLEGRIQQLQATLDRAVTLRHLAGRRPDARGLDGGGHRRGR